MNDRSDRSLLIYVAGPYSADTRDGVEENIEAACIAGAEIIRCGHWPLIPHLNDVFANQSLIVGSLAYEDYMRWDFAILDRCDALLYLAPSPGADRELARAQAAGMKVYRSMEEIPRYGK